VMPWRTCLEAADRRRAQLGFRVCSTSPTCCWPLRDEQGSARDLLAGQGLREERLLRELRPTSRRPLRRPSSSPTAAPASRA